MPAEGDAVSKMPVKNSWLAAQALPFLLVGGIQLAVDSSVFILLSWLGLAIAGANLSGRIAGATLGFFLNGRFTFADKNGARLGWPRLLRFILVWSILTITSTLLLTQVASYQARWLVWLAKPIIELGLAMVSFCLSKFWIYR